MAGTYKSISMLYLPPTLKKNKLFDYKTLNGIITEAYSKSELLKEASFQPYGNNPTVVYLNSCNVEKVTNVSIINRVGTELTYTVELQTGSYQNYITMCRPLEKGETVQIKYICSPTATNLLTSSSDTVYIPDTVYYKAIEILYHYANSDLNK